MQYAVEYPVGCPVLEFGHVRATVFVITQVKKGLIDWM